jgi:hypothetical protein
MIVLTLAFCMSVVGIYAQKADFSGKWTLDVAKSKIGLSGTTSSHRPYGHADRK